MTAHQLDDALAELELLADQLERVEPDLTRSPVTEARLFASTLRYSQPAWATSEGRAEAVADARKVYGLLAYLAAHLTKQAVSA